MLETTSAQAPDASPLWRYFSQTLSNRIISPARSRFLSAVTLPMRATHQHNLAGKFVLIAALLRAGGNNAIASDIMRLSCPQCHTEYEVPDAALAGKARTLRCADCGTKWKAPALPVVAELPPEEIVSEPVYVTSPEAVEPAMTETAPPEPAEEVKSTTPAPISATRTAQPKPTQPKPNRALGVSILLVLLIVAVVLAEHQAIARAWPPSLRLFDALGLH